MKSLLILGSILIISFSSCTTRIVSTAPSSDVVIVEKLPKYHRVVINKGTKYYYWNGKYHKKHRHGYVVVKYRGM
jgi:hypothetical protein